MQRTTTSKRPRRDGRRRHDPAEIRRLLRLRERERLSYAQLSAESGVPVPTLAWWAQRLRRQEMRTAGGGDFVEVIATEGSAGGTDVEIILPSGISVRTSSAVDGAVLARLVAAIRSSC